MSELHLRVVTPQNTVVDRKVQSVTFEGVDGSYGILPQHAALMTATKPGVVTITETDGSVEEMIVTDGFAEMRNNILSLICEAGELAGEIDLERAAEAEARAREQIAQSSNVDVNLPKAEAALRRALLRQMLGRRKTARGNL
ncbi:MAG: ATP synthase F1 subunit epsilon [Planctomycetota bacterium]|nr:ATP synthase F1 subunit epsilon [Planctomycetota bacterium]